MEGQKAISDHCSEESSNFLDLSPTYDIAQQLQQKPRNEASSETSSSMDILASFSLDSAVSSMPVDKGDHTEEMVTRCIVEVLSNALARPNAPPISLECRKILKKGGQQDKDETENESEKSKFAVRLLRDPTNGETHVPMSLEEENPGEEESKRQMEEDTEKLQQEEEDKEERRKYQPSFHLHEDQGFKETRKHQPENSNEKERERVEGEIEKYKKSDHSEEGSQEKHLYEESGEVQNTFLDKRNQATTKINEESAAKNNRYPVEHSEKTHSQEKSSEESEEESEERNSSEKRGWESKNQHRSAEPDESEEASVSEVTRRRLKPRHHHRRYRLDQSFEERKAHSEERRDTLESEESNEDKDHFWDKRGHHKNSYEDVQDEPSYHEEKGNYHRSHGFDDLEEERYSDRASEEYKDKRHHNEEIQEEEEKRNHHNRQIEEVGHHYDGESEEERHSDEDKSPHHGDREQEPGVHSTHGNRDDKRYSSERQHYAKENNMDNERRRPRGRKEQDRSYLDHDKRNSEEGDIEKWQQREDEDGENNGEGARFQEKEFNVHHAEEKMKRLGIPYSPYYEPLQWKNRHFEEKDRTSDQFPKNEEENRSSLNEKTFFPDYNDYDWWDKKPLVEDMNQEHNEKRNLISIPKYDLKKQYDRVDELAQLLNYRKKSDEFPEFYNSDEEMRKHQMIRNENGGLGQRPLTEEEEKELENLAAMDMELQKIAEKFSGTQRG
ncbi:secretogranin-1 isoform X2 [Petaurus breviceps papuanus]